MKIFIGNLAPEVSEEDLQQATSAYGQIASVSLAADENGTPKGFAFVEVADKSEGNALIAGLNGKDLKGQSLRVNEARPEKFSRSGQDRKGWSGLGGGNKQAFGSNKKAGKKGRGGMGYSGGKVGSGEG